MNLEQEIIALKERNAKVEADKVWETSLTRKLLIILLTYAIMTSVFYSIKTPQPFLNALIPTLGFFLSTLSLQVFKKIWIQRCSQK